MNENPFERKPRFLLEKLVTPKYKYPTLLAMALPFIGGQIPMKRDIGRWSEQETVVSAPKSPSIDIKPKIKFFKGQIRTEHQLTPFMDTEGSVVPQQYARQFEKAEALEKADYDKLVDAIEQQILRDRATVLQQVSINNGEKNQSEVSNVRITGIRITGYSSPEAYRYGAESVQPGSVQEVNVNLARKRAMAAVADMHRLGMVERFQQAGIETDDQALEKAALFLEGREAQFSQEEVQKLSEISGHYPHHVDSPKATWRNIGILIELYNTGYVTNPGHRKALNDIVASKRKVEITIDYEGDVKETVQVPPQNVTENIPSVPPMESEKREQTRPMPLELYDPKKTTEIRIEEEKTGKKKLPKVSTPEQDEELPVGMEEFEKSSKPKLPKDFDPEKIPQIVIKTKTPEKSDEGYEWMIWQTYVKDLYPYFNNEQAIARGCDYAQMMQDVYCSYEAFNDDESRLNYLTTKFLNAWMNHDRQARRDAQMHDLDSGLDYYNQPKQIAWAKLHAKASLEIVRQKRMLDIAFNYSDEVMKKTQVDRELSDPVRAGYTALLFRRTEEVRKIYDQKFST